MEVFVLRFVWLLQAILPHIAGRSQKKIAKESLTLLGNKKTVIFLKNSLYFS